MTDAPETSALDLIERRRAKIKAELGDVGRALAMTKSGSRRYGHSWRMQHVHRKHRLQSELYELCITEKVVASLQPADTGN